MKAMLLDLPHQPLRLADVPVPEAGLGQILIKVSCCGVCRTDLHIYDGELTRPKHTLVMGHEVVGRVVGLGGNVRNFKMGQRVGVPWLGHTCGECRYCRSGYENLCEKPEFTGYTLDGGYAEYMTADQHFCFLLPEKYSDEEAAPLLCAGLIGYRSYRLAGMDLEHLGVYGFGAAAHIISQIAQNQGAKVYAFTVPGDIEKQTFARQLGATWAGGSDEKPPHVLDAAILFAPVGALIPLALAAVRPGGVVVCGGIHMSDIPSFPYHLLWQERTLRSVANLTRQDGLDFFELVARMDLKIENRVYPLDQANIVLDRLKQGEVKGAVVLSV